jgi:hypothetical protein
MLGDNITNKKKTKHSHVTQTYREMMQEPTSVNNILMGIVVIKT